MEKRKNFKYLCILIAIVSIIFLPVINYEFVMWDDNIHIYENPDMQNVTISNIFQFWREPYNFALSYTVWAIQAKFAKTSISKPAEKRFNPKIFHITNIIIHLLTVIVVFKILNLLIRNNRASLAGAFLFAIHPVQVESVVWVTGLKDVLSGLFAFIAIWQYLLYAKSGKETKRKNNIYFHYIISLISFLLAISAKPTTVTVPIIAGVLDVLFLKRPLRKSTYSLTGWIILSLPFIIFTKLSQPDVNITFVPPLWVRPLIAGDSIAFYLYKLFFPFSLAPDYGRTPLFIIRHKYIYFTWILPVILIVLIWKFRKRNPVLLIAVSVFVIAILPVSGLIPFIFQGVSTVADRYLYLAMLGPAIIFSWLFKQSQKKRVLLILAVLFLLIIKTILQTKIWRNSYTLFTHTIKINPISWIAYNNLGVYFQKQGEIEKATTYYTKALEINPDYVQALLNMGYMFQIKGRFDESLKFYKKALKVKPDFVDAYNNIGIILAIKRDYKEALNYFTRAIKINPNFAKAYYNMGNIMTIQGKFDEAIIYYNKALKLAPDYSEAHNNLGVVLENKGEIEESIKHYTEALRINPDYKDAYNNLNRALKRRKK